MVLKGVWYLLLVKDYIRFVGDSGLRARLVEGRGLVIEYFSGSEHETFQCTIRDRRWLDVVQITGDVLCCPRWDKYEVQKTKERMMAMLAHIWTTLKLSRDIELQEPPENLDEEQLSKFDANWQWLMAN